MYGQYEILNIVFSFAALGMVALSCIKFYIGGGSNTEIKNNFDKPFGFIVAIAAIIGVVLRVWKFGSVPGGFNQDGAMAAVDANALCMYATDRFGTFMPAHLYAWGYGQMSSLLSYMMAVTIKLFGYNVISFRLPQLLASLAGAVFLVLFVKNVFGKKTAAIIALFVAINPWHMIQSRWALDCNLLPHFFIAGIYFLNKGMFGKKKYIYISMIFFGLCMYCYGIALYTVPVFLMVVSVYYLFKKNIKAKDIIVSVAIYFLVSWPFFITMMINFFKWNTIELPFVTMQRFSDSVRSNDILFFSDNIPGQLWENIKTVFMVVFYQRTDLISNEVPAFGTMFKCSMPFFVAGVIEVVTQKSNKSRFIVVCGLLTGIWVGIATNCVNINRINLVFYFVMIFVAEGIYFVIKQIKPFLFGTAGIYGVLAILLVITYFGQYANVISETFYSGFGEAVNDCIESGSDKIYVTADIQAKGYKHVSEIMTMFYDKTDAEYFQGKKNSENGKKYLPYKERFVFESISPEIAEIGKADKASFVIMYYDTPLFSEDEYIIKQHGAYSSVVLK